MKIDSDVKNKTDKEGGSFYDCSICLEMAKNPVLTCCGHLFCWPCFYQVSNVDSTASYKQCPVCKGEVSDAAVIPVYGTNGGVQMEYSGQNNIPPRPKARRVEERRSLESRMNQVSRSLSAVEAGLSSLSSNAERLLKILGQANTLVDEGRLN